MTGTYDEKAELIIRRYANKVPDALRAAFAQGLSAYLLERDLLRHKSIKKEELLGFFFGKTMDHPDVHRLAVIEDPKLYRNIGRQKCCMQRLIGTEEINTGLAGKGSASVVKLRTTEGIVFLKRALKQTDAVVGRFIAMEVAAFKLSELLKLGIVPETRVVKYKGQAYSCQREVPRCFVQACDVPNIHEVLSGHEWKASMAELFVFDFLGSFRDRHSGNIFLDLKNYKVMAIDNDLGFTLVIPELPHGLGCLYLSGGRLPSLYTDRLVDAVNRVSLGLLKDTFHNILPQDQVEALWIRFHVVKKHIAAMDTGVGTRQAAMDTGVGTREFALA